MGDVTGGRCIDTGIWVGSGTAEVVVGWESGSWDGSRIVATGWARQYLVLCPCKEVII